MISGWVFDGSEPDLGPDDILATEDAVAVDDVVYFQRVGPQSVVLRLYRDSCVPISAVLYRVGKDPENRGILFTQLRSEGAKN